MKVKFALAQSAFSIPGAFPVGETLSSVKFPGLTMDHTPGHPELKYQIVTKNGSKIYGAIPVTNLKMFMYDESEFEQREEPKLKVSRAK